jgi:hypothetical protein
VVLTEEAAVKRLPERIQNIALGLLGLDFRLSYTRQRIPQRPGQASARTRGHLIAKKNGIHLKVVIVWIGADVDPEVHLYQVKSIANFPPSPSPLGRRTFWKVAKSA